MGEGIPLTLSSSSSSPLMSSTSGIMRKAMHFPLENQKLMIQVFVLILLPFFILVLLHSVIATPLMAKIEDGYEKFSLNYQDLISLVAMEIPFAFVFCLLLLFASAVTISASVSAHQGATLGLKEMLLSIKSAWKKILISGLFFTFLMAAFAGVTIILTRLTAVMGIMAALAYPYFASVSTLVLVIYTVEEDVCELKTALSCAREIIRQRGLHGYFVMLMLVLLSIPVYVLFYVTSTDDDDANGLITQLGFLFVATVLLCLTNFFNIAVNTLFYLDYKQRNGEKIEELETLCHSVPISTDIDR